MFDAWSPMLQENCWKKITSFLNVVWENFWSILCSFVYETTGQLLKKTTTKNCKICTLCLRFAEGIVGKGLKNAFDFANGAH